MTAEQTEAATRARLRRDYRDLSPAERVKQVGELSRQLEQMSVRARGR